MLKLSIGRGIVQGVAYSEDGRVLVTLSGRTQLRFWDMRTFTESLNCKAPPMRGPRGPWRVRGDMFALGGMFALHGTLLGLQTIMCDLRAALQFCQQSKA